MTTTDTLNAIAQTVQQYFEGMHRGDVDRLRSIFHAHARVVGYYHGDYTEQTIEEWMQEVEGLPKPVEQGDAFNMCIVCVDVSNEIANVKVALRYLGLDFIDYLNLVRFGERWKIVHKTYRHE